MIQRMFIFYKTALKGENYYVGDGCYMPYACRGLVTNSVSRVISN